MSVRWKLLSPLKTCILLFVIGCSNSAGEKRSSSRLSPPTVYVNLIQPKATFKSKSSITPYIKIVFTHVRGENDQIVSCCFLSQRKNWPLKGSELVMRPIFFPFDNNAKRFLVKNLLVNIAHFILLLSLFFLWKCTHRRMLPYMTCLTCESSAFYHESVYFVQLIAYNFKIWFA